MPVWVAMVRAHFHGPFGSFGHLGFGHLGSDQDNYLKYEI
jgi:hypothetical protein